MVLEIQPDNDALHTSGQRWFRLRDSFDLQNSGHSTSWPAYNTRSDPEKLFAPAEIEGNDLALITKYLAYECYRTRLDESKNLEGDLLDKLDILYWYLSSYSAHRRHRLPISAQQAAFLNSPMPVVGFHYPISIISFTFIRNELGTNWDLSQAKIARDAIYWWSVERSPQLRAEHALVSQPYIDLLQTTDTQQRWLPYSANYFMQRYQEVHPDLGFFDLALLNDRVAYLAYLITISSSLPWLTKYLPAESINQLLSVSKGSAENSIFDRIVSNVIQNSKVSIAPNFGYADSLLGNKGGPAFQGSGAPIIRRIQDQGYSLPRGVFREVSDTGNFGTCYPLPKAPPPLMEGSGISVIGPIQAASGLGQAARISIDILKECSEVVRPVNFDMDNPAPVRSTSQICSGGRGNVVTPINLIHLNAESVPLAFAYQKSDLYSGSYNIGYFFWELTEIPKCHHLALEMLDEVWVSSEYNRGIYANNTKIPVVNVGMAVEPITPHNINGSRLEFGASTEDCVFLTTFDSFSFVQRKNPMAVIRAFQKAFPASINNVRLIVKTQNRHKVDDPNQHRIWSLIKAASIADRRITVINETLEYSELLHLKSICDCYVSLHRSEGWGFGMLEAMQLGVPVIATGYSGNLEFCNDQTCFLVDYRLIEPKSADYIFVEPGSRWAEPDVLHAAKHMYSVYTDRHLSQKKAYEASKFVAANFTIPAVARRYRERLRTIRETMGHSGAI